MSKEKCTCTTDEQCERCAKISLHNLQEMMGFYGKENEPTIEENPTE